LREELAELVDRRPVTTLLVTHDVEEAIGLADRLFLLSPSPARVLAEVPVERPRSARTAEDIRRIEGEVVRRLSEAHA
jgi:NitT/TauT family transport system ATP-binding protein